VARQLADFQRLLGRPPTHLDSHQHVHRDEPVRSVLLQIARQYAIPLRLFSPEVRYRGDFYGQNADGSPYPEGTSVEGLIAFLRALPEGLTELGCHPGDAEGLNTMYRAERAREVQPLCDPTVQETILSEG